MGIIASIILLCLIGFLVIEIVDVFKERSLLEKIAFSYGIGIGSITFQMLIYSLMHIPWSKEVILLPWLLLGIYSFLKKKLYKRSLHVTFPKDRVFLFLVVLIGIVISYVLFEAILRPVPAWDAWSNWFIAGKAFYLAKSFDPSFIHYVNNSNPPLINILVSFTYLINGGIEQRLTLLTFSFFYVCILIVFYYSLRDMLGARSAMVFTLLLATTQNIIRHAGLFDVGHADLPLGYFMFCSVIFLQQFLRTRSWKYLFIFNLFLGFSTLVKSEGLPFFIISEVIVLYSMIKNREYRKILFLLVGLSISLSWILSVFVYKLPISPFIQGPLMLSRIPDVFVSMVREFFNIGRWNFLWLAFFLGLLMRKMFSEQKIIYALFFLQLIVYFSVYLLTPREPIGHIVGSFDRLLLHIAPIAFYLTAVSFGKILIFETKEKKSRKREALLNPIMNK